MDWIDIPLQSNIGPLIDSQRARIAVTAVSLFVCLPVCTKSLLQGSRPSNYYTVQLSRKVNETVSIPRLIGKGGDEEPSE